MDIWLTVLFWSLIGSIVSMTAGALLLTKKISLQYVQLIAVPFAAGALLVASFGNLLPEAFAQADGERIGVVVLASFVVFFVLERFLGWFHHHHEHRGGEKFHPTVGLLVVGDIVHNAIDGLVIGAAFLIDVPTGIVVTLAVAAHEIPQELGDFGLMLALGLKRAKVLVVNLVSALATVMAALFVVAWGDSLSYAEPYLLAVAAGFFIYIAAADLIPTIHAEGHTKTANIQTLVLLVAIVLVGLTIETAHRYIEGDEHAATPAVVAGVE